MNLYSVYDTASESFIAPLTIPNERDAIEGFRQVVNDEKTNYHKFPADFSLMQLGSFDQRTGTINVLEKPKLIINAASLRD